MTEPTKESEQERAKDEKEREAREEVGLAFRAASELVEHIRRARGTTAETEYPGSRVARLDHFTQMARDLRDGLGAMSRLPNT